MVNLQSSSSSDCLLLGANGLRPLQLVSAIRWHTSRDASRATVAGASC